MTADHTPGAPPLDGVRIVDVTQGVGGPFASMLLGDMGADVVKVEPPGGDPLRGAPAFHVLNRGKQSVVLDLETDAARASLHELISDADVFLHDWRPGDDRRLCCDVAELMRADPALVVGWLPPYGSRGPHAHLTADEGMAQALAGVQEAQYRYDAPPVFINLPVAGYAQGILAANAAVATLFARARTGRGDRFEVSQLSALLFMETIAFLRGENVMRLAGHADPRGPIPTYRLVRGTDDWLFCGALTPPFWALLAPAIGLEDCLVDERFAGAPLAIPNLEHRRELARRVDATFATKSRDEWLHILEEANVPRAPALTRAEFIDDPQVRHNDMLVEIDDPVLGRTQQMRLPATLHDTPGRVRGAAPALGEHQRLLEARRGARSRPAAPPDRDRAAGRPVLDGVTVLDLSGYIAGANCPALLADMGADVIKIESPDGDGWRTSGLAFLGSNRGKRGIVVDVKTQEGRGLLLEMAERADVVVDNFRPGVMDRLGIGWDALRARNPRIIHTSVTAYGPTGPYAHLPGFDPLFQARSGLMRAQGEPGGEPVYLQLAVCDYTTALSAAYGTLLALYARERTGRGQRVETSLLQSALTVQAGEFIFYEGRPADPPGGRDLRGRHALYRIYEAADRSLMLSCTTPEHVAALPDALGITLPLEGDALAQPAQGPLADAIAARIAGETAAYWHERFGARGIPSAPCRRVDELFEDEHFVANGFWSDYEHPRWGHIRQPGATVRWDAQPMRVDRRAPLLGEHTEEVLREFGITPERIAALLAAGALGRGDGR